MNIENIFPDTQENISFTPAKKVDLGNCYMIFVYGVQPDKNESNEAFSDDIEKQTENVFENIEAILKLSGATMDDVIKAQIFITDINDLKKVSNIRNKWFANSKPVSTLLEVNAMTRKGTKIEIEVIAIVKK
jgi:Putative translation initiation inhibitor, yjgF family